MASSRKTEALGLNQWDGEDSSEREDFNADNRLIDEAVGGLRGELAGAEERTGEAREQAAVLAELLEEHCADGALHLGPGEKAQLLAAAFVGGAYDGTGEARRRIELGFRPSFGMIWCAGLGPASLNAAGTLVYADTLCGEAASACCETEADGFVVYQTGAAADGFLARLNEAGKKYLYIVWR